MATTFAIMLTIALINVAFLPTIIHGSTIKREVDDEHNLYRRDAKPYGNLVYDKSLPFVPRYRYPVRQYYGKRSGGLYGRGYNPTMYDEETEWSPFMDPYSQDHSIFKRPFQVSGGLQRFQG